MNLSLLLDITKNYAHEEDMPFQKREVIYYVEDLISFIYEKPDHVFPKGFRSSLKALNAFLKDEHVHFTEVSIVDKELRLILTSGHTKESYILEFGLSSMKAIEGNCRFSVIRPDGHKDSFDTNLTVPEEFGGNILSIAASQSSAFQQFNRKIKNDAYGMPWTTGGRLRNIDYVINYESGPEADMIKGLTGILNKTDNQVVLGNLTGETDMVWRAYDNGKPSIDVAPGVIASFLTNDYKVGHGLSMATLRHIHQQIQYSHGSLAALRPLQSTDDIRSSSKLVKEPDVISVYLAGANVDEVEHTIEMLERKGFNQETLPADVYSALQSAYLSALSVTEGQATFNKPRVKL